MRETGEARYDRLLYRTAGYLALTLIPLGIAAQLLHPLPDPDVETSFLEEVSAASSYWTAIHLLSLLTFFFPIVIYLALHRSLRGDVARLLGTLGLAVTVAAMGFSVAWFGADGVAIVNLAEDWEAATAADKELAFRVANGVEEVIFAYFSLLWVVLFGLPAILFGAAVALSGRVPRAGWIGVAAGAFAFCVGLAQLYTGRNLVVTDILIPISGFASGFWVVGMGIWLWRRGDVTSARRAAAPEPVPPAPA